MEPWDLSLKKVELKWIKIYGAVHALLNLELVTKVHEDYIKAGADVITTNTYAYSNFNEKLWFRKID